MVYSRISIYIDFFSMVNYHICPFLAAQPSVISNVKEQVVKCQVLCSCLASIRTANGTIWLQGPVYRSRHKGTPHDEG